MDSMAIRPYMFQRHPAYRTQIEVLRATEGNRLLPTMPVDSVEHERWRDQDSLCDRMFRRIGLDKPPLMAAARDACVYISGALPPAMYGLLDGPQRAHIDADDPLSLFTSGTRGLIPGEDFRRWALILLRKLGRVSLSFWSQIQMANFLANLHASETLDLLESGSISTQPPAIFPRVPDSRCGTGTTMRCLSIANGKFWHKGVPDAIVAVDRLAQAGVPISMTLVGSDLPPDWRAFIESRSWFTLHGRLEREQLDTLFLTHDVLVFLSHHDTYGWVLIEAKSFGMPAVATDSYSRPEIVSHERDGLLVCEPFSSPFLPTHPVPYAASHIYLAAGNRLRVGSLLEPYLEEIGHTLLRLVQESGLLRRLAYEALASVQPAAPFGAATRAARIFPMLQS